MRSEYSVRGSNLCVRNTRFVVRCRYCRATTLPLSLKGRSHFGFGFWVQRLGPLLASAGPLRPATFVVLRIECVLAHSLRLAHYVRSSVALNTSSSSLRYVEALPSA